MAYSTGDTTVYLFTDATSHSCHAYIGLFTFASWLSKTSTVTVNEVPFWCAAYSSEKDWIDSNAKKWKLDIPLRDHLAVNFWRSVIIAELWRPEISRSGNLVSNFSVFFGKIDFSQIVDTARIAPKICQGQPHIWFTLFQISSQSVHFRQSYYRTRGDHFPRRVFTV